MRDHEPGPGASRAVKHAGYRSSRAGGGGASVYRVEAQGAHVKGWLLADLVMSTACCRLLMADTASFLDLILVRVLRPFD